MFRRPSLFDLWRHLQLVADHPHSRLNTPSTCTLHQDSLLLGCRCRWVANRFHVESSHHQIFSPRGPDQHIVAHSLFLEKLYRHPIAVCLVLGFYTIVYWIVDMIGFSKFPIIEFVLKFPNSLVPNLPTSLSAAIRDIQCRLAWDPTKKEDQSLFDGTRLESRTGGCGTRWSRFQMSALQPKLFPAKSAPFVTFVNGHWLLMPSKRRMELAPTCPSSVDLASSWTAGIMRVRWFSRVHHVKNHWRYHFGVCWSKLVPSSEYREVQHRCVNKALSVLQQRRSFSSRAHLHHKKWKSLGACAVAFKRGHRPVSAASLRPKWEIYLKYILCSPSRFWYINQDRRCHETRMNHLGRPRRPYQAALLIKIASGR